jgi:hypothetical protein
MTSRLFFEIGIVVRLRILSIFDIARDHFLVFLPNLGRVSAEPLESEAICGHFRFIKRFMSGLSRFLLAVERAF